MITADHKGAGSVASGDSPAVARRRLRLALRKVREEIGLTQGQVGEALEWSISKVNRIETGEVTISNTDLQALLNLLQVTDPEIVRRHLEDGRAARRRGGWWNEAKYRENHTPASLRLAQFEAEATAIRIFQIAVFPGLLQTAEYAASVIGVVSDDMSTETKSVRLEGRIRRQAQLAQRTDPPLLYVVLDEFVAMRTIGTRAVMVGQLKMLMEAAQRPNVHIRMLPKEEAAFTLLGAFSIYDLGDEQNAVLYREGAVSDDLVDTPSAISRYRLRFEQMWDASLKEEATAVSIEAQYAALRAAINRNP